MINTLFTFKYCISLFFLVYLHIGRGLYYGSYKAPRTLVWTIGTVLFVTMMAIPIAVVHLTIYYVLLLLIIIILLLIILTRKINYEIMKKQFKINILKSLILIWSVNFCLRFPMSIFCDKLDIIWVFYIWCGFVSCISLMVISSLNSKDVSLKSLVKQFFVSIITIYFIQLIFPVFLLFIIYYFMGETWERFLKELGIYLYKHFKEYLILYMAPIPALVVNDPLNQLNRGYDRNGTNQPIGRNIADALEQGYKENRAIRLTQKLLPDPVQSFLLEHLRVNDPNKYNKLFPRGSNKGGHRFKWHNVSNSLSLREGLRKLD